MLACRRLKPAISKEDIEKFSTAQLLELKMLQLAEFEDFARFCLDLEIELDTPEGV